MLNIIFKENITVLFKKNKTRTVKVRKNLQLRVLFFHFK
jgi:hypothetical protein